MRADCPHTGPRQVIAASKQMLLPHAFSVSGRPQRAWSEREHMDGHQYGHTPSPPHILTTFGAPRRRHSRPPGLFSTANACDSTPHRECSPPVVGKARWRRLCPANQGIAWPAPGTLLLSHLASSLNTTAHFAAPFPLARSSACRARHSLCMMDPVVLSFSRAAEPSALPRAGLAATPAPRCHEPAARSPIPERVGPACRCQDAAALVSMSWMCLLHPQGLVAGFNPAPNDPGQARPLFRGPPLMPALREVTRAPPAAIAAPLVRTHTQHTYTLPV